MDDRDRERDAVQLCERRRIVVLRVVLHREDRGTGLADSLAVEELGVEARGLVDATLGNCAAVDLARARGSGSMIRTRKPWSTSARATARPVRPAPKITMSSSRSLVLRQGVAPHPSRLRRADDHDPVADLDRLVTARKDHAVAADDPCDLRVSRDARLAQRHADDAVMARSGRRRRTRRSAPGRPRRRPSAALREPDDSGDRVRGLELGRDHEVDVELALAPHLQVLLVGRPDDRARLGARFREKIAAIRLISSRDVHEIIRSDSSRPASWSVRRLAPFPSIVATS